MIKFFRKIRQNLLIENKIGKYFKYAIGEIVLVVIGILIALQINNWNQQQIEQKQMHSFLLSLKEDLKLDTISFNLSINFFNDVIEKKKNILESSNFDNFSAEHLYDAINPRLSNFAINSTTFTKIKSSGITQITKNDSLSKRIYIYYTIMPKILNDFAVWDLNSSTSDGNYWHNAQNIFELNLQAYNLEESDNIINFQDELTRKQGLVKLLSEPKGRNRLKLAYARKQIITNHLKDLKVSAIKLIGKIENELNNN